MSVLDFADQIHRYSVDEYEDLIEMGAFEDQHVELINGVVLDMTPISPRHDDAVAWLLNCWIVPGIDSKRMHVRIDSSLRLSDSVPQPDVLIVGPHLGAGRPEAALLAIEVAVSSHKRDLILKPRLYAPAVAEYWVLDLSRENVVVHRDPGADGYRDVTVHERGSELHAQHAALGPLRISELLDAI